MPNERNSDIMYGYFVTLFWKGLRMEYFVEMKLRKDGYAGGFSCGMSMCGSRTIDGFSLKSETEQESIYENASGMLLKVLCIRENDVTRVRTSAYNGSKESVELEMLSSFAIRGIEADRVHRLQSFWSAEGKLRTETMEELHMEKSWNGCAYRIEKFGNVGSMPVRKYFPFCALEDSKSGQVIGVQLYCASSWQMEISCKEKETYSLVGGIADGDFGQWCKKLAPGESFTAPEAVVACGESLYQVCDRLVKAQHPAVSPQDADMGILFNEYCTTWGNPSFENVKKICDKIAGKGIKYLVIDSGWYGHDAWWNSIGNWDVNEERFPGGMKPIADYIRSKGMIPGLWFELEALARESRYFDQAEHLVRRYGVPLTVGDRHFWDMEDPWVVEYLDEKVIKLLKDSGFGYLKVDYNDTLGMGCDGAESLGEALRLKVEASKRYFQRIAEKIPGIVIENCSSGGHRLEPSMMELVSQASFSDAHETAAIPLIAANMHRVIRPEQSQIWAVLRAQDTPERIYYSIAATFLGRMCLSGDIYALSQEQWNLVEQGIRFYREAADIIKNGMTVLQQYTTTGYNHPTGSQLVLREYGNRGLAVFHRFENSQDLPDFVRKHRILSEYGKADGDFSARAWIYEMTE